MKGYTLEEIKENSIDLNKLSVRELDLIICSFCLGLKGRKSDKIKFINDKIINRYG